MKIDFEDIIITDNFKNSIPSEIKLNSCRDFYNTYKKLDRQLVINFKNELIDGYIAYIIFKENGFTGTIKVKQCDKRKKRRFTKQQQISYRDIPTIYVYGKHQEDGKEFVWRIPETYRNLSNTINIGDNIRVNTKFGNQTVKVTRIEESNICPVNCKVRKVIFRKFF